MELIKYVGQPYRPRIPNEIIDNDNLEFWQKVPRVNILPNYNPETQRLGDYTWEYQFNEGQHQWVKIWEQPIDLSVEEIQALAQQNYLNNLNWDLFKAQLIIVKEGSAYRQLSEWSKTYPTFTDVKINISTALSSQSHDFLYGAMFDLKNQVVAPTTFSETQLTEINNCLQTLGVMWTWESL